MGVGSAPSSMQHYIRGIRTSCDILSGPLSHLENLAPLNYKENYHLKAVSCPFRLLTAVSLITMNHTAPGNLTLTAAQMARPTETSVLFARQLSKYIEESSMRTADESITVMLLSWSAPGLGTEKMSTD